ncbi:MAG: hypothetical protein K2M91_09090 [Lachnospiraceae bacterium]|nr:hypothetical protein [Lachnospiraceae bacterium]
MGVKEKVIIIICLIIIGVTCYRGRKEKKEKQEKKEEQERQNEELVAAYPEQIKAYLKEKYGREFCVNPRWRGVGGNRSENGNPIPFAVETYFMYEFIAWEDEEDGYAFQTRVYPVSLDDKSILEIRDSYCWKFINRKIRDEIIEAWKDITEEECKIIIVPGVSESDPLYGKSIDENSAIKDVLLEDINIKTEIDIFVIFPPELGLGETELNIATKEIAANFYNEYVKESGWRLWVHIWETYTKEDFLKIEPEKSEQYRCGAKVPEAEYENKGWIDNWIPVDIGNIICRINVEMDE